MRRITTYVAAATLITAATFAATDAAACEPGFLEICAFDNPGFTGSSNKLVRGISSTAVGVVWGAYFHPASFPAGVLDNSIGSIKVGPGTRARICFDPNWGSWCFDLHSGNWPDLGGWNNQISSVRVEWADQSCWDGANWPIWGGEVSIHEHANQTGDCTTKDQPGFEYPHAGFMGLRDNTMTSVRIGEFTQAVICRHANQGTPCTVFHNAQPAPGNFDMGGTPCGNDQASSIEIGSAPF